MTPEQRKIRQLESELVTLRTLLYVIECKVTSETSTKEIMAESRKVSKEIAELPDDKFQAEIDDMWDMMTKE